MLARMTPVQFCEWLAALYEMESVPDDEPEIKVQSQDEIARTLMRIQ